MKKYWIVLCALAFSALTLAEETPQNQWQKQKETERYTIFSADKPGSPFMQVKATVMVDADFKSVAREFGSSGKCWRWQNRCKQVSLSSDLTQLYSLIDMPWPLSDRDFLFTLQTQIDEDAGSFSLVLKPDIETVKKTKYVRGRSHIEYQVQEVGAKQTRVTIYMHTEFGGDVSPSLINGKLVSSLAEDIDSLIHHALN